MRLVLLPVDDRGVELGSVIDTVLVLVQESGRHFLFGLVLGRGLGRVHVADKCSFSVLVADQTLALPPGVPRKLVAVLTAEAGKGLVQAQSPQKAAARGPAEASGKRTARAGRGYVRATSAP